METKYIFGLLLLISIVLNAILLVSLFPSDKQVSVTPLEICTLDSDCGSGNACKQGVLCEQGSDNCVSAKFCQSIVPVASCGDRVCDVRETSSNCPIDCKSKVGDRCKSDNDCPLKQRCVQDPYEINEKKCYEIYCTTCVNECGFWYKGIPDPRGACLPSTENFICEVVGRECVKATIVCGNGICEVGENGDNCPQDCVGYIPGTSCTSDDQCTGSGQWGPLKCWNECPAGDGAGVPGSSENPGTCVSCVPSVSLAKYKTNIQELSDSETTKFYNELLSLNLVSFFYKPGLGYDNSKRIGFLIDDHPDSIVVSADGESVNLYNYISLAVIALQKQNELIQEQQEKIEELENRISIIEIRTN